MAKRTPRMAWLLSPRGSVEPPENRDHRTFTGVVMLVTTQFYHLEALTLSTTFLKEIA